MITNILTTAFIVQAVWYTMLPDEIFGFLGSFFKKHLPFVLHNPVFDCTVCMTPYYGSIVYFILLTPGTANVREWIITIIGGMGLNVIISRVMPKEAVDVHIMPITDEEIRNYGPHDIGEKQVITAMRNTTTDMRKV